MLRIVVPLTALALAACQPTGDNGASAEGQAAAGSAGAAVEIDATPLPPSLVPLPGMEGVAPEITEIVTVLMQTTAGNLRIQVYPEAAPNAAQRFVELVQSGFYDDTPVSRVVPGFVAQFGVIVVDCLAPA